LIFILYYKNDLPLALIEAKDNNHSVGSGMEQALGYAESLDIPFVYSSMVTHLLSTMFFLLKV